MNPNESGRQIKMDRRAFLTLTAFGLLGGGIALNSCSRSDSTPNSSPDQGSPILGGSKETVQEKENVEIARTFLNTMFSARSLPEVTTKLFPLLHPGAQAKIAPVQLLSAIRDYQLCSGLGLKESGYDELKDSQRGSKLVFFDFETAPCKGPNFEAKGIMVELWPLSGGSYATANFTWKDYTQK